MRKFRTGFVAVVFGATIAGCQDMGPVRSPDCAALLIGTWRAHQETAFLDSDATVTFLASGRMLGRGTFLRRGNIRRDIEFQEAWYLENGRVREVMESSNAPDIINAGTVTIDRIVKIDATTFLYLDERGKRHSMTRESALDPKLAGAKCELSGP